MEPVSGMLGFFTLAGEVASIAAKVKNVVASYQGASKEAKRLAEKLAVLEGICRVIDTGLQRPSAVSTASARAELPGLISGALSQCRGKLTEVERIVSGLGNGLGVKSRVKFVLGKDTIKTLCSDLDELVRGLQFALGADIWITRLDTGRDSGDDQEPQHDRAYLEEQSKTPASALSAISSVPTSPWQDTQSRAVSRTSHRTQWYRGYLGQIDRKKTTRRTRWSEEFDDGLTDECTLVSLRVPWLPYQLGLELRRSTSGPLSYALSVTHIVDLESPLGQEIDDIFFDTHEDPYRQVRELRRLLSSGKLSLYSVLRGRHGQESTLLHFAINRRLPLLCRFLSANDTRGKMLEELSRDNLQYWYLPTRRTTLRCIMETDEILNCVWSAKQDDLTSDVFEYVHRIFPDPEPFYRILRHFLQHSDQDTSSLVEMAWFAAVDHYTILGTERFYPYEDKLLSRRATDWMPTFRELIRHGANVHQHINLGPVGSAYFHLLHRSTCRFQVLHDVHEWLGMLMDCGVHIPTYLARERREVTRAWAETRQDTRLTLVEFGGHSAPIWRWATDPGNAKDVLEEFEDLAKRPRREPFEFYMRPPAQADISNFNPVLFMHYECEVVEWPVCRTFKALAELFVADENLSLASWPPEYRESILRLVDFHQGRGSRRWAKRANRGRKARRMQAVMPGGWVDD